eukprot:2388283-Rhodomonas_salina.3
MSASKIAECANRRQRCSPCVPASLLPPCEHCTAGVQYVSTGKYAEIASHELSEALPAVRHAAGEACRTEGREEREGISSTEACRQEDSSAEHTRRALVCRLEAETKGQRTRRSWLPCGNAPPQDTVCSVTTSTLLSASDRQVRGL